MPARTPIHDVMYATLVQRIRGNAKSMTTNESRRSDVSPAAAEIFTRFHCSTVAGSLLAGSVALALLAVLVPASFSLNVPLLYRDDALSHAIVVESVLETGWFPGYNPRLGAPFGATSFDYPNCDGLHLLLLKLIGMFSADWVVVMNLFFLAGVFLCAASAYFALRALGMRGTGALIGALLFALLPYRFLRLEHLFLVAYWSVPLAICLAAMCSPAAAGIALTRRPLHVAALIALGIAVGAGGVYYAFFGVLLIAAAGAVNAISQRSWRGASRALVVIGIIAATVMANLAPTALYWRAHGPNSDVANRSPVEAEYYALKPIQLFLPQRAHRLPALRSIADRYLAVAPLVNENATAALGVVGAAGLLLLIGHGFLRILAQRPPDPVFDTLAGLAAFALAIGTMGGLGSIIAYAGFTPIRAYNRVSVFIAFLGIAGFVLVAERIARRASARLPQFWVAIALLAILCVGVLDQVPARSLFPSAPSFAKDRPFFAALERELPPHTALYQFPYHPYPEAGPVAAMNDYDLSRGYLNTKTLRWSYGAIKGRVEDVWLHALSKRTIAGQLALAAQSGFGAAYVDRRAYADGGSAVVGKIREHLGAPLMSSDDGTIVIWKMTVEGSRPLPLEDIAASFDEPMDLTKPAESSYVERIDGFGGVEPWGQWMLDRATIRLLRPLPKRFALRLETAMAPQAIIGQPVRIRVGDVERSFPIPAEPATIEIPFSTNDETRVITFDIPAAAAPRDLGTSDDRRKLGIGVKRISIVPVS